MRTRAGWIRSLDWLLGLLTGLAILVLPVTSLPALSELADTMVAPPAALFVLAAALILVPVAVLRRDDLPREIAPFLWFLGAALLSSLLAYFLPIPTYKGYSVLRAEFEGLATLSLGAVFYLVFAAAVRSPDRLRRWMRVLNISGAVFLGWGLTQLAFILLNDNRYPEWMITIHSWISPRTLEEAVLRLRVTAMAFEPSWLAHQLNLLYIPCWLACSLQGTSAFDRRLWKISAENLLLAAGLVVLFFSLSRIGLLAFLLVMAYLGLQLNRRIIDRLFARPRLRPYAGRRAARIAAQAALLAAFALAAWLFVLILARADPRVALIFDVPIASLGFLEMATQLGFSERVVFWLVGWNVFARHPLFGVGVGNLGFFFPQDLPAFGYRLYEGVHILYEETGLPNAKSLWTRILGETGIVGFSLFTSWLYVQWRAARYAAVSRLPLLRAVGWAGQFTLLAFLIEGFSVDSFALPYIWVALGLVSAAGYLSRQAETAERKP